jgi:predicted membrane chloride channel (bestrophin family)
VLKTPRFGEEVQQPFNAKHDGLALDVMTRRLKIKMRQRARAKPICPKY